MSNEVMEEIQRLKQEKNAVILVHNYQLPEVQDVADLLGDSLDLSKKANDTESEVIVFCGVRFMAETAKILSPEKKVLLPVHDAGCPMADMITVPQLLEFKEKHPGYKVVCYVNTTADIKAESDICVTSANAVKIIKDYPHDKFIFVPDKNLGRYVHEQVPEKDVVLWDGYCNVHVRFNEQDVLTMKNNYPDAALLVHPECNKEILDLADFIQSTNQMINFIHSSKYEEFLIGTEEGIIYRMQKENPGKKIYPAGKAIVCPNMKKTRIQDVRDALKYEQYEVELSDDILKKARKSLEEMLKYS